MKFLKLILFLLITNIGYGQYQQIVTPTEWSKGGFKSLFIPKDTTVKPTDTTRAWIALQGAILYKWDGVKWLGISSSGGSGNGSNYVLPQATADILGGIKYSTDFVFDGNGRFAIAPGRKTLWDEVARLKLFYMTGDSTKQIIHDSAVAHDYNFSEDFAVDGRNVSLNSRNPTGSGVDSAYYNSVWYALPSEKPLEWDSKVSQQTLNDTAAAIRAAIKTTYFNGLHFTATGPTADTINLRNPNGGTGGSGGSVIPYNNDPNYYWAGDSAFHQMPTPYNPNDSIDYSFSSMTTVYNEAGPGEYVPTGNGITANKDNTTNPFRQLKAVDIGGWTDGDYISFTNGTVSNSTAYTFLRGFFRLKTAVSIPDYISFAFYNNGTLVSKVVSVVNYGLDKNKVGVYQNISIPMSAFGFTSNTFNELRMIFGGTNGSGLYLDLLQFQNSTALENTFITDVFRQPGTRNVFKVVGGTNVLAFTDSVGTGTSYTDVQARAAISLTTTGTSGAATYNNSTGVLNIPSYTGSGGSSQWTTVNTNDIYYNLGNVGIGSANTPTSRLSVNYDNIGVIAASPSTNNMGLSLENNTASGSSTPQYSPMLRFRNTGWKTNATAGSQTMDWRIFSNSVAGATTPASSLFFDFSSNGASYANAFQIGNSGNVTAAGNISGLALSGTSFATTGSMSITNGGGTNFHNGLLVFPAISASSGSPVQYSPGIRLQGNAWDATAGANYQNGIIAELRPIAGTPTRGLLVFNSQVSTSLVFPGTDRFAIPTDGGVVLYPMTKAQRDAIVSPQQGRIVFVSDNGGYLSYYNAGWFKVSAVAD